MILMTMMTTTCDDTTGIRAECCWAMPGMQTHIMPRIQYYMRIVWVYDEDGGSGPSPWWFKMILYLTSGVTIWENITNKKFPQHLVLFWTRVVSIPPDKKSISFQNPSSSIAILKLMFLKIYMTASPATSCKATAVHHLQMKRKLSDPSQY